MKGKCGKDILRKTSINLYSGGLLQVTFGFCLFPSMLWTLFFVFFKKKLSFFNFILPFKYHEETDIWNALLSSDSILQHKWSIISVPDSRLEEPKASDCSAEVFQFRKK